MRRCGGCRFLRSEYVYRIVSYHDDWQPPRAWRPAEADHPFQRRREPMKIPLFVVLGGCGAVQAYQVPSRPFWGLPRDARLKEGTHQQPGLWAALQMMPQKALSVLPLALSGMMVGLSPVQPSQAADTYTSTTVASAFDAMCLGFGCGSYNGIDFAGQAATSDEPSISFPDFLKALDAKQVQKVELTGPNGDRAYASLVRPAAEGESSPVVERLLIGEGYPIEASKAWSSPLWVVRILKDRGVPVSTSFDFSGVKTQAARPPMKI